VDLQIRENITVNEWGWINLRHDEVDGHILLKVEGVEGLRILGRVLIARARKFFIKPTAGR